MRWINRKAGRLFGRVAPNAAPRAPDGQVIYAVGDIHGRLDLLNQLLDQISEDAAATAEERATLIFLGDYIDRGPDSRSVLETLRRLKERGGERVVTLKGNHEQAFLLFLADPAGGASWVEHGGRETLQSYGVHLPSRTAGLDWDSVRDHVLQALPDDHVSFLAGLTLFEERGDYVFVHAGLRPGVALEAQAERDLLWIRDPFLKSDDFDGRVVVHGHTPVEQPLVTSSRIGVDTGAYATGALTAVKLQGEEKSFISTRT